MDRSAPFEGKIPAKELEGQWFRCLCRTLPSAQYYRTTAIDDDTMENKGCCTVQLVIPFPLKEILTRQPGTNTFVNEKDWCKSKIEFTNKNDASFSCCVCPYMPIMRM